MKSTFLLLLVFGLSSFHASAQSHFITAGQTQGMIFTDYVPDYSVPALPDQMSHDTGSVNIDMNRDGINDFRIYYFRSYASGNSVTNLEVFPSINCSVLIKFDTCTGYVAGGGTPTQMVAKRFLQDDSMEAITWTQWTTFGYNAWIYSHSSNVSHSSGWDYTCTDNNLSPDYVPYYYFVRIILGTDTLLGYIHIQLSDVILDYAIQGPTSSYIISSTNDLPSDKSITTYPNPFTNQININYAKPFDYQITDYVGRTVSTGKAERTINTNDLPAGNYLLLLKNEEMSCVRKVIK